MRFLCVQWSDRFPSRVVVLSLVAFICLEIDLIVNSDLATQLASDSDHLVLNRISLSEAIHFLYPLVAEVGSEDGANAIVPYLSQFGLQGIAIALFTKIFQTSVWLSAIIFSHLFALALAVVLGSLFAVFSLYYGWLPSALGITLLSFSPWIFHLAFSLYWTGFLLFLPFTICWLLYPKFLLSGSRFRLSFLAILAAAVLLKSLCGYEYITNVILSCAIPIGFYHLEFKAPKQSLTKNLLAVLGAAGLGFLLAIGLHCLQISWMFGGGGLDVIVNRISDRTVSTVSGDHQLLIDYWVETLPQDHWLFQSFQGLLLRPALAFGLERFFTYFRLIATEITFLYFSASIACFTLISMLLLTGLHPRLRWFNKLEKRLIVLTNISLLVSVSWQVLAFNHMSVHLHINGVVYYLPFLTMAYLLLGVLVGKIAGLLNSIPRGGRLSGYFLGALIVALTTASIHQALERRQLVRFAIENPQTIAEQTVGENFSGFLDSLNFTAGEGKVDSLYIAGWAVDIKQPREPVEVFAAGGDRILKLGKARFYRPDVNRSLEVNAPRAGFSFYGLMVNWMKEPDAQAGQEAIQIYCVSTNRHPKLIKLA